MEIDSGFEETKFAFDLRMVYATIVGRMMMQVQDAIEEKNYSSWLNKLKLLFPVIFSRVDNNREELKAQYHELLDKTLVIINKHEKSFAKRNIDSVAIWEIEEALSILQHFIYRVLHTTNQFGKEVGVKGLY